MKKQTLILIGSSIVFSSCIIIILFITSFDFKKQKNAFIREFPPHPLFERDTFNIKYNSYYIAGGTTQNIYLGNTEAPLHILELNLALADTQFVSIKLKDPEKYKYWSVKVKVDSPYFYVTDGTIPAIFRGNTTEWYGKRSVYDSAYFVDFVPISSSSFALRSLSSSTNEHVLGKETVSAPHIKFVPGLLEKQIDGIFCVDGMLRYDRENATLIYTYFYRNQFIVMDTSMNLLYRGKTIDTVSRAQIEIATINSNKKRTMSAPPLVVNRQSTASGNFLFVASKLPANNENMDNFDNSSIIDVYDLRDGTYHLSFYLYDYEKEKMKEFIVLGNTLVALYDHYILTYDLRIDYFNASKDSLNVSTIGL